MRVRVLGWVLAIVVVIGVIASIPMLPLLIVAWVAIAIKSPGAAFGMGRGTASAIGSVEPGKLYGVSGRLLFPIVTCGWVLIAFLIGGLVGQGVPGIGWLVGLCLLIGPTFLVYRSMHPEIAAVPIDEWLGSRRPGPVGIAILTWIASVAFILSLAAWTSFLGAWWTTVCTIALFVSLFLTPFVALAIAPRMAPHLYRFIAVATVFGLVTLLASLAGLTPPPPSR